MKLMTLSGTPEIADRAGHIRQKITRKHAELDGAESSLGPAILGIIGALTAILLVGIILILIALLWQHERHNLRPKLWRDIATLETQLRGLEQR